MTLTFAFQHFKSAPNLRLYDLPGMSTDRVKPPEEHPGLFHEELLAEFASLSGCAVAQKHLKQKAALLGLASEQGLLSKPACYIEFGAGRGMYLTKCLHSWNRSFANWFCFQ